MRTSGNGSSAGNVARAKAVTGPISTKGVWRATTPARRRVTRQAAWERARCAGWTSWKSKRSARNSRRSRKWWGSTTSSSTTSSQSYSVGGVGGEQAVEVLELPELARRAEVHLDVVARARQLRADRAGQRAPLRALHAEHQHTPARGRAARGAIEAQAPAAEQLAGVHQAVVELAPLRVETPDGAAFPGEEVLGRGPFWRMAPFAHALFEPPEAVGDHRQAGGAAPADDVAEAAGERAQLAVQRRRVPAPCVVAAAGAPAGAGGAGERAQARVGRRAAVVERGGGDVQDRSRCRCARRPAAVPATPARRRRAPAPRRRARPAPALRGARSCWPPTRSARGRCPAARGRAR